METIEKDGRTLTVREYAKKWKVSIDKGRIQISYDIAKEDYPTFEELKEYLLSKPIF